MGIRRRRVEREMVHWRARYLIEGRPEVGWRPCRVIDVSTSGAALELPIGALDGRTSHLILELVTEAACGIQLHGRVRHLTDTGEHIRAGIEFVQLTQLDRDVLDLMLTQVSV